MDSLEGVNQSVKRTRIRARSLNGKLLGQTLTDCSAHTFGPKPSCCRITENMEEKSDEARPEAGGQGGGRLEVVLRKWCTELCKPRSQDSGLFLAQARLKLALCCTYGLDS